MFSSDKKPMIVSDDQAKITSLMAKMTDYERLVRELRIDTLLAPCPLNIQRLNKLRQLF